MLEHLCPWTFRMSHILDLTYCFLWEESLDQVQIIRIRFNNEHCFQVEMCTSCEETECLFHFYEVHIEQRDHIASA